MEQLIEILKGSQFGLFILGVGVGVAAIFLTAKKLLKPVMGMWEDVIEIKSQQNGRLAMAQTLPDHEKRLSLIEQAVARVEKTLDRILNIIDRRHTDIPVSIDRRENDYNRAG